jgi:hypothetical protein
MCKRPYTSPFADRICLDERFLVDEGWLSHTPVDIFYCG